LLFLRRGAFAGLLLDLDGLLMRLVDVMLAFPFLLLVMAIGRRSTTRRRLPSS